MLSKKIEWGRIRRMLANVGNGYFIRREGDTMYKSAK